MTLTLQNQINHVDGLAKWSFGATTGRHSLRVPCTKRLLGSPNPAGGTGGESGAKSTWLEVPK